MSGDGDDGIRSRQSLLQLGCRTRRDDLEAFRLSASPCLRIDVGHAHPRRNPAQDVCHAAPDLAVAKDDDLLPLERDSPPKMAPSAHESVAGAEETLDSFGPAV